MHDSPRALLLTAALGLAPALAAQTSYVDVTDACGLTMTHTPDPSHPMVAMVGGATVADFNQDGWPDIFVFSGGTVPDRLFINNANGTFSEQSAAWGLTDLEMGSGACAGDYDKDGWPDLFITSFGVPGAPGPGQNRLYRNNGNGTFTDVAAQAGVQWSSSMADGFGCCWGDYDLDGWLDLFVANYIPGSKGNRLFRNNHDGTFTEVSRVIGLAVEDVHGFVPTFADMDGDRWPEFIFIGDTGTSEYYVNNGNGTFTDSSATVQDLDRPNGMGLTVADINGDGLLDFYVSNIYDPIVGSGGNMLYINQGGHNYTEEGRAYGVYDGGWGWGVVAFDFDNDGWMDLGATNGWPGPWDQYPTMLYHSQGGATFTEVAQQVGLVHLDWGRSMDVLDYDRDGDLDVLISSSGGPLKLYRNDLNNGNGWLRLRFDTSGNRNVAPEGYGTRVEVDAGGRTQVQFLSGGQGYLGHSELTLHFGLGNATVVDEVRIDWADGFRTVLRNVPANQELLVQATQPFLQSPLVRGQQADFVVQGARPGEVVLYLYSLNGTGDGPKVPALGNLRLDLLSPVQWFGTAVADPDGIATYSTMLDPATPLVILSTQAVIQRGMLGRESCLTNTITMPVLP